MTFQEYHKIQSIYKRDQKGNFIVGEWTKPEFEYLADKPWTFDEKIDGTNIRIGFDGYNIKIGGRTDRAQIPAFLLGRLAELFSTKKMREVFETHQSEVVLYGEGFGARIQKGGGLYLPDSVDFILFDVRIGNVWLQESSVTDIASQLGLRRTSNLGVGTIFDAVNMVKKGFDSKIGTAKAEGLILRPTVPLFDRMGRRIITKIKCKDFK